MALSATETIVGPFSTVSTVLYTAPTTYARDLVLENRGTATVYVGSFTAVTAVTGLAIPSGQRMLLQGPTESVWGITSAGTATMAVGLGSVVALT